MSMEELELRPQPKRSGRRPFDICRGVPIAGITGVNGAGKTLLYASSLMADLYDGREVYSTVPVTSPWGETKPILSLRQLLQLHDATVGLDEVAVIFSSRQSGSLPAEMVAFLQTARHRKLTIRWTAPAWMRCDNLIREVTQACVVVHPLIRKHDGSPWPQPRLCLAGLLDTTGIKPDANPEKVMRRRFFVPTALQSFGSYDTHADTPMIGQRHRGGRCVDCGGSMEVPKHSAQLHERLGLPFYDDIAV